MLFQGEMNLELSPSGMRKNKKKLCFLGIENNHHQHVQVPKIELLNHIRLLWGWVFPYCTYALHTAYIGEYLHFRYLKCLVKPPHRPTAHRRTVRRNFLVGNFWCLLGGTIQGSLESPKNQPGSNSSKNFLGNIPIPKKHYQVGSPSTGGI